MGATPTHKIKYPEGASAPNVPVVMQTAAESTEAALDRITKAPLIICEVIRQQYTDGGAIYAYNDMVWDAEVFKQGITHAPASSTFVVPESGIYQLNCRIAFQSARATCLFVVNVNGVDQPPTRTDEVGTITAYPKPHVVHMLKLTAGDALKIRMAASDAAVPVSSGESFLQLSKVAAY